MALPLRLSRHHDRHHAVIAKPASQTVLTAMHCIRLLHRAGIPAPVLQFLPMGGSLLGEHLLSDSRVAGIAFTGSTDTGQSINLQLARHHQAIVPVIAETGGQNVMIADSSALLEQLVQDAFDRFDRFRVLYRGSPGQIIQIANRVCR